MFRIIFIMLFVFSCAKHSPENAIAKKTPVNLNNKMILQLELKNHYSTTDTFTLFFFPEVGTMNWASDVFNKNDSDEKKLSSIVSKVVKYSDLIDEADLKSYTLLMRNKEIEKQMQSSNCSSVEDDFEFKSTLDLCESMGQEILDNIIEINRLSSTEKSEHLRGIQMAIDDVQFEKVDESTYIKQGNVINWVPYGDQNSYEFKLFNTTKDFKPEIILPTLGVFENKYTTHDGDIYDVRLSNSKYAPNTLMLTFKVKEKDNLGNFNGVIWDCELEKSNFAGKIRFSGDVFRKNARGKIIQQGIMKFELAENEFALEF